nr:MAG TPA: hypothetical protein [Caudoviricetes sp.]
MSKRKTPVSVAALAGVKMDRYQSISYYNTF